MVDLELVRLKVEALGAEADAEASFEFADRTVWESMSASGPGKAKKVRNRPYQDRMSSGQERRPPLHALMPSPSRPPPRF